MSGKRVVQSMYVSGPQSQQQPAQAGQPGQSNYVNASNQQNRPTMQSMLVGGTSSAQSSVYGGQATPASGPVSELVSGNKTSNVVPPSDNRGSTSQMNVVAPSGSTVAPSGSQMPGSSGQNPYFKADASTSTFSCGPPSQIHMMSLGSITDKSANNPQTGTGSMAPGTSQMSTSGAAPSNTEMSSSAGGGGPQKEESRHSKK